MIYANNLTDLKICINKKFLLSLFYLSKLQYTWTCDFTFFSLEIMLIPTIFGHGNMGIVATYFENKLRTENYFQNALNLAQSYELSIFFKGLEKIKVYYEGISTF